MSMKKKRDVKRSPEKDTFEKNAFITHPTQLAPGVEIRYFIEDERPQRRQMVLVIDEDWDPGGVINNRKLLNRLRQEMDQVQGKDVIHPTKSSLYGLYQWHRDGVAGWKISAFLLNYMSLALMVCAYDEKRERKDKKVKWGAIINLKDMGSLTNATIHEYSFLYVWLALRKGEYAALKIINQALDELDNNQLPWQIKEGPFNGVQVRSKVGYLQKQIDAQKRAFSENTRWNRLEFNIFWLYKAGYIKKIDKMLNKTGTPESKRINQSIREIVNKIIEKWESSDDLEINTSRKFIAQVLHS